MSERRIEIVLGTKDRTKLKRIVADGNTLQKIVKRAKIVVKAYLWRLMPRPRKYTGLGPKRVGW